MKKLLLGCLLLGSMSILHAATISFNQGDYKLNIVNDSKFILKLEASSALVTCNGETRRVLGETSTVTVHDGTQLKYQATEVLPYQTQIFDFELDRTLQKSTSELSVFLRNKVCNLSFQLVYQLIDASNETLISEHILIFLSHDTNRDLYFTQEEMPAQLRFEIEEERPGYCLTRFTLPSNSIFRLIDSLINDPSYRWGSRTMLCK